MGAPLLLVKSIKSYLRTMRPILKSKANLVMMDRAWALTDTSRNGLSGLKQQNIRRLTLRSVVLAWPRTRVTHSRIAFHNHNIHSVQSETLPEITMAAVKALVSKVMGFSDLTHATLAVGASSALIPLLPSLSPSHLAALHLSSLATGLGTQMYVSFVAGPTMFMHLPRHVFGDIQARLFPKMGMVTTGTSLITLATYSQVHHTDTATSTASTCSASVLTSCMTCGSTRRGQMRGRRLA